MSVSIPRVEESSIVDAPLDQVWDMMRTLNNLPRWWRLCSSAVFVPTEEFRCHHAVGGHWNLTFTDGARWTVCVREISDITHRIAFDVIDAEPTPGFTSMLHFIQVQRVTATNASIVTWTTEYSTDATVEAISDSRYKRLEACTDLASVMKRRDLPASA